MPGAITSLKPKSSSDGNFVGNKLNLVEAITRACTQSLGQVPLKVMVPVILVSVIFARLGAVDFYVDIVNG